LREDPAWGLGVWRSFLSAELGLPAPRQCRRLLTVAQGQPGAADSDENGAGASATPRARTAEEGGRKNRAHPLPAAARFPGDARSPSNCAVETQSWGRRFAGARPRSGGVLGYWRLLPPAHPGEERDPQRGPWPQPGTDASIDRERGWAARGALPGPVPAGAFKRREERPLGHAVGPPCLRAVAPGRAGAPMRRTTQPRERPRSEPAPGRVGRRVAQMTSHQISFRRTSCAGGAARARMRLLGPVGSRAALAAIGLLLRRPLPPGRPAASSEHRRPERPTYSVLRPRICGRREHAESSAATNLHSRCQGHPHDPAQPADGGACLRLLARTLTPDEAILTHLSGRALFRLRLRERIRRGTVAPASSGCAGHARRPRRTWARSFAGWRTRRSSRPVPTLVAA